MKTQLGQTDIFFPIPAALLVTGSEDRIDISTVAWIGMVSSTPPTLGISLDKTRYSLDLIKEFKHFTINIPSADQYREVDYCGIVSGRTSNKFSDTGLTPIKGAKVNSPIIMECPFNLECVLTDQINIGNYVLSLAEIVETHMDSDKVVIDNGAIKPIMTKVNPLIYYATVREYWNAGQQIGNAFSAGKELLDRELNNT